ncbi:hypothetical protein ACH5RR_000592 [Cinchona calisaya]|uniref:Uncharacterized protein n=1 Tax=Cinchona calisaya TaxID=153742 RepID=A0ABD3B1A5_9GENT
MAEEERNVDIMSVKFAIQRELAYREKVASYISEEEISELLPLEVPSSPKVTSPDPHPTHFLRQSSISPPRPGHGSSPISTLTMVAGNDVTPSFSNLKPLPVPSKDSSLYPGPPLNPASTLTMVTENELTFSIPNIKPSLVPTKDPHPYPGPSMDHALTVTMFAANEGTSSISSLTQSPVPRKDPHPHPAHTLDHIQSLIAKKATTSSSHHLPNRRLQSYHSSNVPNIFCKICEVSCTGSVSYRNHVRGHKHKAKLRFMQLSGNVVVTQNTGQQPKCNVCKIFCSDQNNLDLHLKGQKHKAKLLEIELGQNQNTPQQFWCELCQVPCTNEETFRMHLKGKNHAARSCALGKQKKAI